VAFCRLYTHVCLAASIVHIAMLPCISDMYRAHLTADLSVVLATFSSRHASLSPFSIRASWLLRRKEETRHEGGHRRRNNGEGDGDAAAAAAAWLFVLGVYLRYALVRMTIVARQRSAAAGIVQLGRRRGVS